MKTESACPVCKAPVAAQYRPFCSARCANVDLGRWLKGAYIIPGEATSFSDGGEGPDNADAADKN